MRNNIIIRPRRNRASAAMRSLTRETQLRPECFVLPLFVVDGINVKEPIASMPGCFRLSLDQVLLVAGEAYDLGIRAIALFPKIADAQKDSMATESLNINGLVPRVIGALKAKFPEVLVIADVAMDPYSSDGHDGIVKDGKILNDESLEILAAMAVVQAKAGADLVAPSDMMDGRIGYIRDALDKAGCKDTGILSYAAKYASAFYGPFRDALDSAPRFGDKKTYQMDPANRREALREVNLDVNEGADIVMVKPALAYLDIIREIKNEVNIPVAAYQVSGEYSMICAAAERGWLDKEKAMTESLLSIHRAGADIIFTYFALDIAKFLRRSK
jgi:porphobilinogen synthase